MNKSVFQIDTLQAILLDFDGVLCECMNVKTEAFAKLFESYGEDIVKKVTEHHVKYGGISRYEKIEYYFKEYLNKPISENKLNELAQKFSDLVVNKVIASDWVNGAQEFLEKYYKEIDLYVISGTPIEELNLVVEKRNMGKYFKGVFGSPITKPVHIRNIIKENKYDSTKVLYIGDSLSDYQDAKQAEISFLGRITSDQSFDFPKETTRFHNFTVFTK